jgi:DnaK suppressor protein
MLEKTGAENMTTTELNDFQIALEDKRTELGIGNRNREELTIETSPDDLDRIQHANDRDWVMSTLERNSNRLNQVQAALRRIVSGTFGICVVCDKNINPKRLAALPWASSCIVCQQVSDLAQKSPLNETEASLVIAA